jgi:hypothetical protein
MLGELSRILHLLHLLILMEYMSPYNQRWPRENHLRIRFFWIEHRVVRQLGEDVGTMRRDPPKSAIGRNLEEVLWLLVPHIAHPRVLATRVLHNPGEPLLFLDLPDMIGYVIDLTIGSLLPFRLFLFVWLLGELGGCGTWQGDGTSSTVLSDIWSYHDGLTIGTDDNVAVLAAQGDKGALWRNDSVSEALWNLVVIFIFRILAVDVHRELLKMAHDVLGVWDVAELENVPVLIRLLLPSHQLEFKVLLSIIRVFLRRGWEPGRGSGRDRTSLRFGAKLLLAWPALAVFEE